MIRNQDWKEMDDCFSTNLCRKNGDSLDHQEWIFEIKERLTPNPGRPGVWEPPDYHGDLYSRSIPLGLRLLLRPRPFPDRWFEKVEFSARCSNNKIIEWSWSTWKFSLKSSNTEYHFVLIPWVYFLRQGMVSILLRALVQPADTQQTSFCKPFFLWRKLCFVAGHEASNCLEWKLCWVPAWGFNILIIHVGLYDVLGWLPSLKLT